MTFVILNDQQGKRNAIDNKFKCPYRLIALYGYTSVMHSIIILTVKYETAF